MSIEILALIAVALVGVTIWYFNKDAGKSDLNNDGKVDIKDAVQAVENAVDGTAAVVKSAAKSAKRSATKAATKAKGTSTRKPRATKPKAGGSPAGKPSNTKQK